jgi:hypothetical protein
LVRGSKTAIRWRDPKRVKKVRSHKKTRSAKFNSQLEPCGIPIFEDDSLEGKSAPHSEPADFVPLYAPETDPSMPTALPRSDGRQDKDTDSLRTESMPANKIEPGQP